MRYCVYVIESVEGYRYTGQTDNLGRRLSQHNTGKSHSTKHGSGWTVVYMEECESRAAAMKREKCLKSSAGRRSLEKLIAGWNPSMEHGRSSPSGS
ncbi:MAG TPA: GIY-YIG nuclease family protein [Candidatus Kryptonia bacterium]